MILGLKNYPRLGDSSSERVALTEESLASRQKQASLRAIGAVNARTVNINLLKERYMSISLETARLNFRRLENDDAEALFRTVGDPEVMEFWSPGPDNTVEKALERIMLINDHWNTHGFGDWAIIEKEHQRLIGFCGLHYITDMAEVNIGYALEKSMWQKGLGTEVVNAVLNYGFNFLHLNQIVAVIDPHNIASIKLVSKCGLNYWKDSTYMGRPRVVYKISDSK